MLIHTKYIHNTHRGGCFDVGVSVVLMTIFYSMFYSEPSVRILLRSISEDVEERVFGTNANITGHEAILCSYFDV